MRVRLKILVILLMLAVLWGVVACAVREASPNRAPSAGLGEGANLGDPKDHGAVNAETHYSNDRIALADRVDSVVAQVQHLGLTRECIASELTVEDISILHEILATRRYINIRNRALRAICVLDTPENAFQAVKTNVEQYEDWRSYQGESFSRGRSERLILADKAISVADLGYLPAHIAAPYLIRAFRKDSAADLLSDWQHRAFPTSYSMEDYVEILRVHAAIGLAMLGDGQSFRCVAEEYERLRNGSALSTEERRDILVVCSDAVEIHAMAKGRGGDVAWDLFESRRRATIIE